MSEPGAPELSSRPWLSASLHADEAFWTEYISARPSPTESFFELIQKYHIENGGQNRLVHDVATGPGNIAIRLAKYFDTVLASDINKTALDAGRRMLDPLLGKRIHFVKSSAMEIGSIQTPSGNKADAVVAGECMPLLDHEDAIASFHNALAVGGTLAMYFYGRPIFVNTDGSDAEHVNETYATLATRCTQLYNPHVDDQSAAFHIRTSTTIASYLDNIALAPENWSRVQRLRWNCDRPLLFSDPQGYHVPPVVIDKKTAGEKLTECRDRRLWASTWVMEDVKRWIRSTFPRIQDFVKGSQEKEIEDLFGRLCEAMGGAERPWQVSWPVVLVLARKSR